MVAFYRFIVLWGSFFNSTLPGHWFLVEHANLCSSSVLDRLNPLLEIEGQLIISERGVLDGALKVFALFLLIASRLLTCRCLESGH
jgi:midasin (ATPase involved in ribosome maturation)